MKQAVRWQFESITSCYVTQSSTSSDEWTRAFLTCAGCCRCFFYFYFLFLLALSGFDLTAQSSSQIDFKYLGTLHLTFCKFGIGFSTQRIIHYRASFICNTSIAKACIISLFSYLLIMHGGSSLFLLHCPRGVLHPEWITIIFSFLKQIISSSLEQAMTVLRKQHS